MQSTGLTVNCIDSAEISVSAAAASGSSTETNRSARKIMSEAEAEAGEIAEYVSIVDERARRSVVVEALDFGNECE